MPNICMSGQSLAAIERVRRRPEFERIYAAGARIHARFMTLFVLTNGGTAPRFGVAATKKLGSAVERNLAKRRAREVFRRHKITAGLDIVIVPRREMLDVPFSSLEADYQAALTRRDHERPRPPRRPGGRGPRTQAASRV